MASLASLPVELSAAIIQDLAFIDRRNLSVTCRALRAVAFPLLLHTIAFASDQNTFGDDFVRIGRLLRALLVYPAMAKHIRKVQIRYGARYNRGPERFTEEMQLLYERGITPLGLPKRRKELWDYTSGRRDIILCMATLLILQCTNLQSFETALFPHDANYDYIQDALHKASLVPRPLGCSSKFSRLQRVSMTCSPHKLVETLGILFSLPNVTEVKLSPRCWLKEGSEPDWNACQLPTNNKLVTLHLDGLQANGGVVKDILSHTPNLKELKYDRNMYLEKGPFQYREFAEGIASIQNTIETLDMSLCRELKVESDGELFINHKACLGSLRHCVALKTLRISLGLLLGYAYLIEDGLPVTHLSSHLPPNLEHFAINDHVQLYTLVDANRTMRPLRAFLTGEIVVLGEWNDTHECWPDYDCTWQKVVEPPWKTATPRLRCFTFDLSNVTTSLGTIFCKPNEHIPGLKKEAEKYGLRFNVPFRPYARWGKVEGLDSWEQDSKQAAFDFINEQPRRTA
ncbi:hypothetical protein CC80DRAFT_552043 [Byssothecium circinans]|uniref:F-box domain-containing protein n=1 Tax=Byssothecium circinans TaxID=147558 RepID=A0A6A5TJH4_9PLEO|nr:hypothetical protein CC80DRAFT_552043 [Byssothecium circinans]